MTVKLLQAKIEDIKYIGLSSDTKPTINIPTGSIFYEIDTLQTYVYDGTAWQLYGVPGASGQHFDVSVYPVRAQGAADGVQYGTEVVTVTADTNYVLLAFSSYDHFPRLRGLLSWVYYNISFMLKAGSATADVIYKLQACNKDGTWTDMCAAVTCTNINTTYVAYRVEGYLDIKTNITQIPFKMQLIIQSNEATPGIATGKVKNDTVIRAVGSVGGIS